MGSWFRVRSLVAACALSSALAVSLFADVPLTHARAPAGVAAPFADAWQAFGAEVLGAPVSPPVEIDGRLMQFFAYGALVADDAGGVARYAVGSALAAARDPDSVVQRRRSGPSRAGEAFAHDPERSFAASLAISDGYERLGGEARFGAAISRPYTAAGRRVQWFEFGRIVWSLADRSGEIALDGWELARTLRLPVAREVSPVSIERPAEIDRNDSLRAVGFAPARIQIPTIGVDAWVENIGIVDGVMQTPVDAWNVGWYGQLPQPGGYGNAVFAAHRDWWNVGPVVFYRLGEVTIGETIVITGANGERATYRVTELYTVPADADFSSVIASNGGQEITLITCFGTWDGTQYVDRLIVRGVLIQ